MAWATSSDGIFSWLSTADASCKLGSRVSGTTAVAPACRHDGFSRKVDLWKLTWLLGSMVWCRLMAKVTAMFSVFSTDDKLDDASLKANSFGNDHCLGHPPQGLSAMALPVTFSRVIPCVTSCALT